MKKFILCVFAVAACLAAFGQGGRVLGVRAGLNVTNIDFSAGSASVSLDSRASFNAGFVYQQPLMRMLPLYLETGLYVTGRGASINAADFDLGFDEELSGKVKFNMLYLQVPVAVSWHFNIKSVSIQPLAGVFYGLGIHGKAKFKSRRPICSNPRIWATVPRKRRFSSVPTWDCVSGRTWCSRSITTSAWVMTWVC